VCFGNRSSTSGAHLPALPFCGFRRGGRFGWATGEHLPKPCDLSVYASLLGLEAFDGGGDDFRF
jgi:hypothetical protein